MAKKEPPMKKGIPLFILLTLLSLTVVNDNPLPPIRLNELVIAQGGEWTMELRLPNAQVLDGWGVASQADTAFFKPGMVGGPGFYAFTKDSLQKPVRLNPTADRIELLTSHGGGGTLTYGDLPNSQLVAPRTGQSVSYRYDMGFYYLDNTPTLGSDNDTLNAMGGLDGLVTDTLGFPLRDVAIRDWYGQTIGSDSLGRFALRDYALKQWLFLSREGYNSRQLTVQMYPESVVALTVKLTSIVSVHEPLGVLPAGVRLLPNYPNPFNPATFVSYELPRAMEVHLSVFDMQGRSVAVLAGGRKEAGRHRTMFDGSGLPSGIYFCRLCAEGFVGVTKLVLLR
jgi:hypothetical protein